MVQDRSIESLENCNDVEQPRRDIKMQEPQDVTVSMNDRFLTIELPINDDNPMANVFLGLTQYVKEGFGIKLRHSYRTFSGSLQIVTKVISKPEDMAEWMKEAASLISIFLKRPL